VDTVIGDNLYTLQFRVEENMDVNEPTPMDMDDYQDDEQPQDDGLDKCQCNDG
jgi:hypothetical protein